jgi:hypothetical protein
MDRKFRHILNKVEEGHPCHTVDFINLWRSIKNDFSVVENLVIAYVKEQNDKFLKSIKFNEHFIRHKLCVTRIRLDRIVNFDFYNKHVKELNGILTEEGKYMQFELIDLHNIVNIMINSSNKLDFVTVFNALNTLIPGAICELI